MKNHENVPNFGGRRLALEGHVFEVIALAGEPTSVIFKDAQAWAVRQVMPEGIWYGGAIHMGAEPLDADLAERVFYQAT